MSEEKDIGHEIEQELATSKYLEEEFSKYSAQALARFIAKELVIRRLSSEENIVSSEENIVSSEENIVSYLSLYEMDIQNEKLSAQITATLQEMKELSADRSAKGRIAYIKLDERFQRLAKKQDKLHAEWRRRVGI